ELLPADDTGLSNTDHVTSATRPTFQGAGEPGALVSVFGANQAGGAPFLIGAAPADSAGTYLVPYAGAGLADGTYTITARRTAPGQPAPAANAGPTQPLVPDLVVDTPPPAAPTLVLDPAYDTGVPGDNRTSAIPQLYDGTAEPGTRIVIRDSGQPVAQLVPDQ